MSGFVPLPDLRKNGIKLIIKIGISIYEIPLDEIQYGAFINAVGIIIAIVGIWNHPKTADLSDSDEG